MLSWKFCQIVMKKLIFKFCNFCHFSTTFFLWFINASMITFTICISENVLEEKSRRKSPPKCLLWSGRKNTQVKETAETYYTNREDELPEEIKRSQTLLRIDDSFTDKEQHTVPEEKPESMPT